MNHPLDKLFEGATDNLSMLNKLAAMKAPPPGYIKQIEEMYGVRWDAAAGKFVEAES